MLHVIVKPDSPRQRMIVSAAVLMRERGVQATSFSEVLEHSGAPRGSVYHHFPEGKNQMIDSALDAAGATAIELLDRKAGAPAPEGATWVLHLWRKGTMPGQVDAGWCVAEV